MKAIIELDVPVFQIGQEVTVFFKDTMQARGVCIASPIVRCLDCNKRGTRDCLIEVLCPGWLPGDNWFCADGEKED